MKLDKNDLKEIQNKINKIEYIGYIEDISNYNLNNKYTGVLYLETKYLPTYTINEDQYKKYEQYCEDTNINDPLCEIIIGYDVSGFNYWNDEDNGQNYINIAIFLKKLFYTNEEIKKIDQLVDNLKDDIEFKLYQIDLLPNEYY